MCRAYKFLKLKTDGLACHVLNILQRLWLRSNAQTIFQQRWWEKLRSFLITLGSHLKSHISE